MDSKRVADALKRARNRPGWGHDNDLDAVVDACRDEIATLLDGNERENFLKRSASVLKTEINDPEIAIEILEDASRVLGISEDRLEVFYDHGQHWVEDRETGAIWSAVDASPGPYAYEQISAGVE